MEIDLMRTRLDSDIAEDYSVFMEVVKSLLWTPYMWGGDDPSGFDCSGMVVEALKAAGRLEEHEDFTADGLWHVYFSKQIVRPRRGALIFKFDKDDKKAVHVGVCSTSRHYVAAEGGGSHILSLEDAWRHNAFIKPRPIRKIKNPRFADPWKD